MHVRRILCCTHTAEAPVTYYIIIIIKSDLYTGARVG